jgi:hypothetical protein
MEIVRQVLAALLVVGAVAVAVWARRRNGGTGWSVAGRKKAERLIALERVTLGPHHTLHVVRFGERLLLLAAHAGGCTLLASSARQEYEASPERLS